MNILKTIRSWWHGFFRKRRFAMLNASNSSEGWYIHLSPASIIAGLVAFVLFFFILVLTLMAYTPVLEFLPGYRTEADKARESLVQNIIRVDSIQRVMNDMMTYNENIALIMEGQTPVAHTYSKSDSTRANKILVMPSHEDSLLRAQMEGDGEYSLTKSGASPKKMRETMSLSAPVEGIITERFSISDNRFGVHIAAASVARISTIDKGTVIQTLWTPEFGYVAMIQQPSNLVSVYKNLSQLVVLAGQTVRRNEQIGYNAEKDAESGETKLFEFELWSNGKPVNPEEYIPF